MSNNKALKGLKVPGLDDIYYVPETIIDETLTQEGQAADAKAVGEAIANAACAEPYYVYIIVNGSDIKLDTFHEFSGEEFFDAIAEHRPIYLREDSEYGQVFTLTRFDHDEGCALFSRTSIVNNVLEVQQVTLSRDGTISSSIATNKTDATLTLQNRAADAAVVGQRLAALEAASTPAYTYGEEDLVPGETPLETGKLHFVYI